MKYEVGSELTEYQTDRLDQYNFLSNATEIMTNNELVWFMNLGTKMLLAGPYNWGVSEKQLAVWNNLYLKVKKRRDDNLILSDQEQE